MSSWQPDLTSREGPRYLAIVDAIVADIRAGRLSSGDRLPSQRKLAQTLSLNFTTVARAYVEAQRRGLIESRVGQGTIVCGSSQTGDASGLSVNVDLTMNLPPEPTDPDLLQRMRDGIAHVSRNLTQLLRYQEFGGAPADKDAATAWLGRRALVPAQHRLIVVPGAHTAIFGILSLLAKAGDTVLCEAITYPGVRSIAAQLGIRLVGLPMDRDGIDPEAFAFACETRGPKALYVNPTLHNPTTTTVPEPRREALAAVARQFSVPIIEDDAYGFVAGGGVHPFAAIAPDITWHIAGLAKCIGAGLRAAYVIVPKARDGWPLAAVLRAANVMASPLTIAIATRWIEDGTADSVLRFIRAETAARQKLAAALLPKGIYVSTPGAFNLWIDLPGGWTRSAFAAHMRSVRIGIVPSDAFAVEGPPGERVRVCLGGPIDRTGLQSALDYMGHALAVEPAVAQSWL